MQFFITPNLVQNTSYNGYLDEIKQNKKKPTHTIQFNLAHLTTIIIIPLK